MPFTASHPAAVLPFVRVLPPAALVAGSMAPDFPYFVPLPVSGSTTHSWTGVVTVDVLLAAVAWAAWQFLVGPAFVALTPPVGARAGRATRTRYALLIPAFVVGAATHVAWDSFTHASMWGVVHIPALRARYGPLPGYAYAQHLSTLLGGAVLLCYCWRWWRSRPVHDLPPDGRRWEPRVAWTAVALAGLAGSVSGLLRGGGTWTDLAFDATTIGGGAAAVTVLLVAILWRCGAVRSPSTEER